MEIFTDTAETFYNWLNISYNDWIDEKKNELTIRFYDGIIWDDMVT